MNISKSRGLVFLPVAGVFFVLNAKSLRNLIQKTIYKYLLGIQYLTVFKGKTLTSKNIQLLR